MKNKIIIITLAIFIVSVSMSSVFAEEARIGTRQFDVPNGYTISENGPDIVLTGNNQEITVTNTNMGHINVKTQMESEGYTYVSSSNEQKSSLFCEIMHFEKGNVHADAYVLSGPGAEFTIIAIDYSGNPIQGNLANAVDEIINDLV